VPNYLYGDSSPFADGYDFLRELRSFVEAASQALLLSYEADQLEQNLGERAQEHLHAVEAIQNFFENLTTTIAHSAARSGAPQLIGPYARQILEQVETIGTHARQSRNANLDQESMNVTQEIGQRRNQLRQVLQAFLLADPLPTHSWALSLNLGGTAPQGQAVLVHPGQLTTCFALEVGNSGWSQPRKLGELSPGMTIQVGFKKAFLRSSLNPDVHSLDEFYVTEVELGPDSMEVHLRKKMDAPRDSYILDLDVDDSGASVARVSRREGDPFSSQGEDLQRIEELASVLRAECAPLLQRKRRLIYAQLDEHDVFERGLTRTLLERIAARLAPIAAAVNAHSPNDSELSLKFEHDDGRREEIYLKKAELVQMVEGLPEEALMLFEPLAFLPKRKPSIPPAVPPLAIP
jgi:hypothetical protein